MTDYLPFPPVVRTDASNPFAQHTMHVRVPEIFRRVQANNPDYTPQIQAAIDALCIQLESDGPITMLDLPAADHDDWVLNFVTHSNDTWLNTDWFFAETFAYRHLIQAVRWWETRRDPFAPIKQEEITSPALWQVVEGALAIGGTVEDRLARLLTEALWGNRMDLSFASALAKGLDAHADDLLVDDRASVVDFLMQKPQNIHVIADNFGTEFALDMVLIDALLAAGLTGQIVVHLKVHPTYVSDATVEDALAFLRLLESGQRGPEIAAWGGRLRGALDAGQLRFAPDLFWNSANLLNNLPPRLARTFLEAKLVIFKGDLNYRRLVGDAIWPGGVAFADAVRYFPAPLLALRSLKSDPMVGLSAERMAQLDATDARWRVSGQYGVVQAALER